MAYTYTYLIGSLLALAFWLALFFHRKDVRKEMLFISTLFAFIGLFLEGIFWVNDWWTPEIVTGTLIGVEDFIYGFAVGGIAAVVYEELFKRRISPRKKKKHNTKDFIILIGLFLTILPIAFFFFRWHSFPSTILAFVFPTVILLIKRRDLITDSLATGVILTILGELGFLIINAINPGFVHQWWYLDKLSGILVFGFPLEDLVWYFAAGMFIGPLYEFWQNKRLVRLKL